MAEEKKPKAEKPAKAQKPAAEGAEAKEPKKAAAKAGEKPAAKEKPATAGDDAAAVGRTAPMSPRMKQALRRGRARSVASKQFGYKNALEVPTIEKIVLNMGVGEAVNDTKKVTSAAADLA